MAGLIIVVAFFVLLIAASFAGLGADSRDPEVSLFRGPRHPPFAPRGGAHPRY
jgi:hypothetical protein